MNSIETSFDEILALLSRANVRFILIGGVAAMAHGNARATFDIDFVYARDRENIRRLVQALAPLSPYLRGAPPGLPFVWDEKTLRMGLNFTLTTSLGDLDLFGEVAGAGNYAQLLPHSEQLILFGVACRCASLESLICMKRAAGRPKDLLMLAELQALLEGKKDSGRTPS